MVTVELFYANTRYVDTTLRVTFFGSLSDGNSTATIVLSVVFGIAGAFLIAAAIVLLIFHNRRKQNTRKFRLVEPNYDALIFNEDCNYIVSKKVQVSLAPLEEFISDEVNWPILIRMCRMIEGSDLDRIAKALLYSLESLNLTMKFMKVLISDEVRNADTALNVVHDGFVNHMFLNYCKLVGLPYIWQTLANHIHEVVSTKFEVKIIFSS